MKKINIVNLSFDKKTKIVMLICIIIAICIIIYSFYYICIENGIKTNVLNSIENLANICEYNIEFNVKVYSNKNEDEYKVIENSNILENRYSFLIDDELNIQINSNEIKISKKNIDYQYLIERGEYKNNNFISFSSIINIIKGINNQSISGNIKKVELDGKIKYKICTDEEYINKIKSIELIMSDNEEKVEIINMYDSENKEKYVITINNFILKK